LLRDLSRKPLKKIRQQTSASLTEPIANILRVLVNPASFVREWKRLGFDDVVDRFRKKHSLKKLQSLVENSYISEKRKKALLRLIFKRSEELCEI